MLPKRPRRTRGRGRRVRNMPDARMHRITCLDCQRVFYRVIVTDMPVYCRGCGSEAVLWYPA
jgi:ribosomal protein S27E